MPQGFEPFELLDCTAVVAFRLGLIADEQGPTVGLANHAMESLAQQPVTVLGARDFDIAIPGEFRAHEEHGVTGGVEGLVEAGGEEAGLKARGAEDSLLCEGDALDGKEFLGVDGLVDGNEVGSEVFYFMEVFEADDGEGGGSEAVISGILCGASLA